MFARIAARETAVVARREDRKPTSLRERRIGKWTAYAHAEREDRNVRSGDERPESCIRRKEEADMGVRTSPTSETKVFSGAVKEGLDVSKRESDTSTRK